MKSISHRCRDNSDRHVMKRVHGAFIIALRIFETIQLDFRFVDHNDFIVVVVVVIVASFCLLIFNDILKRGEEQRQM